MTEFKGKNGICFVDPFQIAALEAVSWLVNGGLGRDYGTCIHLKSGQSVIVCEDAAAIKTLITQES